MNSSTLPPPERDDVHRALNDLRDGLHDLAQQQRRLQTQVSNLMDAVEALAEDGSPVSLPPATPLPRTEPPPTSLLRRGAKALLRRTLGTARRLWQASRPSWDTFEPELAEEPATALPSLALVLVDPTEENLGALRSEVERQTYPVDLVIWRRAARQAFLLRPRENAGHPMAVEDLGALRRALAHDYLAEVPLSPAPWLPTTLELLLWTLASEDLDVLDLRRPSSNAESPQDAHLRLMRREWWAPRIEGDPDLLRQPVDAEPTLLAKELVGPDLSTQLPLDDMLRSWLGAPGGIYRGRGRLAKRHSIHPLHGLPVPHSNSKGGTLLVLDAPLHNGLDRWVARVLRAAKSQEHPLLLAILRGSDSLQERRLQALSALDPHLFPLADFISPETLGSGLLAFSRRGFERGVFVGPRGRFERFRGLENWNQLAWTTAPLEDLSVLRPEDASTEDLAQRRASFRGHLGLEDDSVLVLQQADLVADQRPEDFVTLAHHLRGEKRLAFLLVGQGPLAGGISDLQGYLDPPRLHLLEREDSLTLLAAADVVVSTAERLGLPGFPLTALAQGKPWVCADAEDLPEELRQSGGVPDIVPVGRPDELASRILGLAQESAHGPGQDLARTVLRRREDSDPLRELLFPLPHAL